MRLPALGKLAIGLVALWGATSGVRADDWSMFQGGPGHTGQATSPLKLPISLAWKYVTQTPVTGQNLSSPVVAGGGSDRGRVFFAAKDHVYCLDVATGESKWFYPKEGSIGVNKPGTVRGTPAYLGGLLYVPCTDGTLFALDTQTGEPRWQFTAKLPITTSPIIVNGVVYFGSDDGGIYAIQAKTGKPVGTKSPLFQAPEGIMGALSYSDSRIYFLCRDQYLYCIDPSRLMELSGRQTQNRAVKWRYRTSVAGATVSPTLYGDMLYLGDGSSLVAMTAARGRIRWRYNAERAIVDTPAVGPQGIFFSARDDNVYCVGTNGVMKWKQKMYAPAFASPILAPMAGTEVPDASAVAKPGAPPKMVASRYYVVMAGNRGLLYAFDAADGTLLWDYKAKTADIGRQQATLYVNFAASPALADGWLFAFSDDGTLLAFSEDQQDASPPYVSNEDPVRGAELSGQPPINFSCTLIDEGSGVDFNTVSLKLDGEELKGFKYDEYFGLVHLRWANKKGEELIQPLKKGVHVVSLEASDWRGNQVKHTWQFTVNPSISSQTSVRSAPQQ
ncbi:MAG TPA: PQQ-binding-like beta-propeller repeat protein [Armatimonadota bacterium]|jgi:outer membrane protein assembly factor BamB